MPDQWEKMIAVVKASPFHDLITVMKETGCRPQETRIVSKRHFNQEARLWVFPKEKSKRRKVQRVVPLNQKAFEICQRLALKHPYGPRFRNTKGQPWKTYAMNCGCARIEKSRLPSIP